MTLRAFYVFRWMVTAIVACLLASPTSMAAPVRPLISSYDAQAVTRRCDEGIVRAKAAIVKMEAKSGGIGFLNEWNRVQIEMEDVVNPIYLMGNVHPDKAVRDAADPCLTKYTTLSTELFQSERLYARAKAVQPKNPRQAKLRKDLIEGFEDTGVALPPEKRARAKAIFDRLEVLRQTFSKSVRDDSTQVIMTSAELEGLPESYVKAQKRNADGHYVLGLASPVYSPFMANAKNEAARQRFFIAKMRQGGVDNLGRLDEIYRLRKELAALYDRPSFAHYSLLRKMAKTPETVTAFLDEVKSAITALEKKEVAELREEKAKVTGKPVSEISLHRWDVAYWQERIRKSRYAIDQEKLRAYFPTDKSIAFALLVSETLYGVKFRERATTGWHPDVRYFDVIDGKSGAFLAGFYLDLYPRDGKYHHAAAFPVRGGSTLAKRTPLSVLVTNFNRVGLTHDEMETLFHEFGHVLHGVLSRTDYLPHAGTSTPRDFVEAPSQMFEEWVRREETLGIFAKVCPDCPQLTKDDIARLESARRYGQGVLYGRQWLLATYDMSLSTDPKPPLREWKRLEVASPLGHVEGTWFPAQFNHIAADYAAGYYGYMWSEVMALDMLSMFSKNMLDPKVGRLYRDTVLSQGGQVEPLDLVRRFLGRDPSREAFFFEITGQR